MQTSKWGGPAWYFNHKLPLFFPEILDENDVDLISSYLVLLKDILPCKYCRASYSNFIEEIPPKNFIETPPSHYKYPKNSRLSIAKWLEIIHDKVNTKLRKDKPQNFLKTCCACDVGSVQKFCENFWSFFFTIVWNYIDEEWRREALTKFVHLLKSILVRCPFGEKIVFAFDQNPLTNDTFASIERMKLWAYSVRKSSNVVCGEVEDFEMINEKYESWRAGGCNEKKKIEKNDTRVSCL